MNSFRTLEVQVESYLLHFSKINENRLEPSWARLAKNLIPPVLALLFLWLTRKDKSTKD